jgi:hypothetical protein
MIPGRYGLLAVAATILVSAAVIAQQQPIHGCNAASSCRPLGFSTLDRNAGFGGSFFGVGARWGPGFGLYLAAPQEISLRPATEPESSRMTSSELFHLHASLLPPTPAPTPVPTPGRPGRAATKAAD